MNKKLNNILLPEETLLVTEKPEYYKPKGNGLDLSAAKDLKYTVGIIEKVSLDMDPNIVGAEVFYYKSEKPTIVDIKNIGCFQHISKANVLLVDITIINNSNNENNGKESE